MSTTVSGPLFEPALHGHWISVHGKSGGHYNTFALGQSMRDNTVNVEQAFGMKALREFFPKGEANEYNVCLFSTSGVHGMYTTIEEVEKDLDKPDGWEDEEGNGKSDSVTFLIIQPRIVCLRYGNCYPKTKDDIKFLKKLRASSHEEFSKIGLK